MSGEELVPFFQPILGAAAGEVRGFEALLLHWRNSDEDMQPRSRFFDDVIGRRTIRESCGQAVRWFELTGALLPVSVNVAPVQLWAPDFCDHVARCLATCGLPAAGLIIEMTESALVADRAKTRATLECLIELGVRVRLDEFGARPSALADLRELPVSGIKLDRGCVNRVDGSAEERERVRVLVALAHQMEMDVVAEGIETASQLERARELGCDFAQGSGFSRPLNAEQAIRYVGRHMVPLT